MHTALVDFGVVIALYLQGTIVSRLEVSAFI